MDKKNPEDEDAPPPPSTPALYPHPPPYSALEFLGPPYHMYYHPPQYSNGAYYAYSPLNHQQHTPYPSPVSTHPKPLSCKLGKPLLTKTPPLMPHPPPYVPLYPHLTPQPGWNIVYPVGYNVAPSNKEKSCAGSQDATTLRSNNTAKIQKSPDKSFESNTTAQSASHPKLIKLFKFLEDCNLSADINNAEILIRGFLFDFDSSGDVGYLTSGSDFKVEIPKEAMYVMGKKIDADKDFAEAIAVGSNIKVLARKISLQEEKEGSGEQATYRAVIAWFGELPDIIDLKPVILQFKDMKEPEGKSIIISQDRSCRDTENKKIDNEDTDEGESEESKAFEVSHINGYMWWANRDQGIMRIYEAKGWGPTFSGIIFKVNSLHFDGQKASCEMLHFLAAHLNKCYVYARRIEPKTIHGMLIKWEASSIDCGSMPRTLMRNIPNGQSIASLGSLSNSLNPEFFQDDTSDECSLTTGDLMETKHSVEVSRRDLDANDYSDNSKENSSCGRNHKVISAFGIEEITVRNSWDQKKGTCDIKEVDYESDLYSVKDLSISDILENEDICDLFPDKYSGKHLTGRIVKLFPMKVGAGIALWKSMDYGNVYIIFRQNDMFVDLIPINKMMELPSSVYSRQCNLYVLPIKARFLFGFRVQLVCTCGWLGTKPSCIPTPGEQLMSKIALDNLESDTSYSKVDGSEALDSCKSSCEDSHPPFSYSNEIQNADGKHVDGDGLRRHSKNKLGITDKVLNEDTYVKKDDQQSFDCYHTGEVVEIHCNMGKLMSEVGNYYFSREQCFLYGVSLSQVELWHVLIHGQKISFTLNRSSKGQSKVEKVAIGHKDLHLSNNDEVEKYIKEWCTNNAVPDCAKDTLVNQLKNS